MSDFDFDHPMVQGTIKTYTGIYFNVLDPDPDHVHIRDIAHALSMICRYGGHVPSFYSVAEHSINVANQVWRRHGSHDLALSALLHDAGEAYIGDVVSPLKHSDDMAGYRVVESTIDAAIESRFGLVYSLSNPQIKEIDRAILEWEMAMIRDREDRTPTPHADVRSEYLATFYQHGGHQ